MRPHGSGRLVRRSLRFYDPHVEEDDDRREWSEWAAHGYAKRWTPRSVLRIETVVIPVVAAIVFAIVWFGFR
jgi:hypothetical protein